MKVNKTIKITVSALFTVLIIAVAVGAYLFNMPHRDVQSAKTDFTIGVKDLMNEYLSNSDEANARYLQEEGDSKIILYYS